MIALFVVLAPVVGLAACSTVIGVAATILGLDGPCVFDPPPGDHFPVTVVNDTRGAVQISGDQPGDVPIRLLPGKRDHSLTGSCGEDVRVVVPNRRLLGCLDMSSQDVEDPSPLRVSRVGHCDS